jgi:ubiquitin carboxyl-terminal hydrolase 4/11/15
VNKTPPILIITLKRFKGNLTNQKQNTPVYYPIEGLNMKNFMIPQSNDIDQIYDLFAVVLHTGTLNGGHYTAVAKNYVDKGWYEFNDH